ncbi:E3 ubiquitin-protein ligase ZFP91 [Eurytemora carolleeae]|uniref:E3 ubiquitin-protein ligase ZFP91 n=1 Tax=Eurytemora carolleeae TaxID=1294199 RepID=UPI000C76330F|nr:E3 ubiquitin-protein ligase ZFP91 [Eurytemora carolleeae]|eukprot:XP_023344441.1 E3 ubiquitin-protein ligase ZFP91-like [Eurytemora affinis]
MVKPRESQDQFQMFGSLLRTRDSSIYTEILESGEQTSLRIHRSWQPQPGGVPSLSPPIFLLLSWKSSSQLSLSTLTYNEETICSRFLQGSALCTEAEVRDVISVLQEPCTPCSGLGDTIQNASVSCILIERFGDRIYYRSRDCTRIIKPSLYPGKSPDDICTSCLRLVSPELSMENKINHIPEEVNMSPDLSVYQGEEEEKEETKSSEKNSKTKVLQEQPEQFIWEETPEKKPEVSYVCPEVDCKRRFRRKKSLEKHLTEAHKGNGLISCPVPSCKRTFKEVGRKLAVHINKIHPDKELIGTTKLSAPELRYARGPALGFKHFSVLSICY